MRGAQQGLPVVGCDGGAEEDKQGGEDGGREKEGEDEGEESGLYSEKKKSSSSSVFGIVFVFTLRPQRRHGR